MKTCRRKLSTFARAIKLALAPLLVGAGCAGSASVAPFPARPDTVVHGDLRGPFEGRVLDAESGKPVEGAAVLGSWAFEGGRGLVGPAGTRWSLVETDTDGRYRIAALSGVGSGVDGHLARFTVIIYKRGYVAWRSDRRFDDLSPRFDFAQRGAVMQLRRLPADVSHARHLAFVGAAGPLLPRMAWELPLAGQETAPAAEEAPAEEAAPEESAAPKEPEKPAAPNLDARVLLGAAELQRMTGFKGEFGIEPLADVPSSPVYDSVHFRAVGKPESFDAAMRVFKVTPEEAERQFDALTRELPRAKPGNEVGTRSLQASEKKILALGTLDRPRGVVLLFTCGEALCKNQKVMLQIVKQMASRFDALGKPPEGAAPTPPAAPAPPATPAPTPPPEELDRPLRLKPPELKR